METEALQLSLFDEQGLAEITTAVYPGERIVLCRNPLRARKSAYNRERLLAKTDEALEKIVVATRRKGNPLRSMKAISLRVGKLIGKWKMEKHFDLEIKEGFFSYERDADSIASEASLDGMYAIRSSLKEPTAEELVHDYKRLSAVEQAFRSLKTVDLKVRPIHHYRAPRVICHVFLCMLAYFVEWHMKQRLAPILFAKDDPEGKKAARRSIIHAAGRSPSAEQKARSKWTQDGHKALNFAALMAHLRTLCKHQVEPLIGKKGVSFTMLGEMTDLQARAFELLRVKIR